MCFEGVVDDFWEELFMVRRRPFIFLAMVPATCICNMRILMPLPLGCEMPPPAAAVAVPNPDAAPALMLQLTSTEDLLLNTEEGCPLFGWNVGLRVLKLSE